jgi:hypothetical protein
MTISKENRVPRGRPKIHNFETKQEYFRNYYKLNRDRWNVDHLCPTCELYCSFVNKARHARSKFHLKKLAEKGLAVIDDKTQLDIDKTEVAVENTQVDKNHVEQVVNIKN